MLSSSVNVTDYVVGETKRMIEKQPDIKSWVTSAITASSVLMPMNARSPEIEICSNFESL